MEAQHYIEAIVHILSDLIILYLVFRYFREYGVVASSLLIYYLIFSLVFFTGILGLPYAAQLMEILLSTEVNSGGTDVPTNAAVAVGFIAGGSKVGLAIALLLITKRLITKHPRSMTAE